MPPHTHACTCSHACGLTLQKCLASRLSSIRSLTLLPCLWQRSSPALKGTSVPFRMTPTFPSCLASYAAHADLRRPGQTLPSPA